MKFLDYKFVILIGLTIVIYFIYREIEFLRIKVQKLENKINKDMNNLIEESNDENNIFSFIPTNILKLFTSQDVNKSHKKEELECSQTNTEKLIINTKYTQFNKQEKEFASSSSESRSSSSKKIILDIKPINNNIEDQNTISISNSSRHLAIYSNDNDQYNDSQNSLLESINNSKNIINDLQFNYENNSLKSMVTTIINNIEADLSSSTTESLVEVIQSESSNQSTLSKKSGSSKQSDHYDQLNQSYPTKKTDQSNNSENSLFETKLLEMGSSDGDTYSINKEVQLSELTPTKTSSEKSYGQDNLTISNIQIDTLPISLDPVLAKSESPEPKPGSPKPKPESPKPEPKSESPKPEPKSESPKPEPKSESPKPKSDFEPVSIFPFQVETPNEKPDDEHLSDISNLSTKFNKMDKNSLEKLKLPELKKIAELNNITLSKKIGNQQRNKNKQELIDNILIKISK